MSNVRDDTPVYPIGVVRKLTQLSERQIRYYEQVGLFRPARSAGQRRLFSQLDVERLLHIKREMERGLHTAEIRAALRSSDRGPASADRLVPTSERQRLPHFAGGESTDTVDPDVETRRSQMTHPYRKPNS
jgi:DNA-binding transcriptional MerR regulator